MQARLTESVHDCAARDWAQIVRSEYEESPGLSLTLPQVKRLWGLDDQCCGEVLRLLVESGYLRRTETGTYVRRQIAW